MNEISPKSKILLHACCGPCSLEPYRLLHEDGWDITIYFSNDNIYPESEFELRYKTLLKWANDTGVEVVCDNYDNERWADEVESFGEHEPGSAQRKTRCRHCYRQRFERCAVYAEEHGFNTIGTTLSVSPYQYTNIIKAEIERAAKNHGLQAYFVDFTPYYRKATEVSKELGMYRQDYCGCDFSARESDAQKQVRAQQKAQKAKLQKQMADQAKVRAAKRQKYNETKRHQRQLLKEYKSKHCN